MRARARHHFREPQLWRAPRVSEPARQEGGRKGGMSRTARESPKAGCKPGEQVYSTGHGSSYQWLYTEQMKTATRLLPCTFDIILRPRLPTARLPASDHHLPARFGPRASLRHPSLLPLPSFYLAKPPNATRRIKTIAYDDEIRRMTRAIEACAEGDVGA